MVIHTPAVTFVSSVGRVLLVSESNEGVPLRLALKVFDDSYDVDLAKNLELFAQTLLGGRVGQTRNEYRLEAVAVLRNL